MPWTLDPESLKTHQDCKWKGMLGQGWFMTIHWCPRACNEFTMSVCVVLCGLNDCKSQAFRSVQMKNPLSFSVPVPCPQFYGACEIRGRELNSGIPEQDCKLIPIECWSISEKAAKSARKPRLRIHKAELLCISLVGVIM